MAHHRDDDEDEECKSTAKDRQDLDKYELWTVIQEQVRILRDEMDDSTQTSCSEFPSDTFSATLTSTDGAPAKYFDMSKMKEHIPPHSYPGDSYSRTIPIEPLESLQGQLAEEPVLQQSLGGLTMSSVFDFADRDTGLSVAFGRCHGSIIRD